MATEEIKSTNPTIEEIVQAITGKLAISEAQLAVSEIKIDKQAAYITQLEGKLGQWEEGERNRLKE